MDRTYFFRYLIAFFIIITIIALLVFGVIRLFGGGDEPRPATPPPSPVTRPLPEYSDTQAAVSMTIDGRINGEDVHRGIRVTVDKFQRKLFILGGYDGNILEEHNFENNERAYDIFLRALNSAGFSADNPETIVRDERGQCPLGTRTIYELRDNGEEISKRWSSSCGSKIGTQGGNQSLIQRLFQAQITDYRRLVSDVRL